MNSLKWISWNEAKNWNEKRIEMNESQFITWLQLEIEIQPEIEIHYLTPLLLVATKPNAAPCVHWWTLMSSWKFNPPLHTHTYTNTRWRWDLFHSTSAFRPELRSGNPQIGAFHSHAIQIQKRPLVCLFSVDISLLVRIVLGAIPSDLLARRKCSRVCVSPQIYSWCWFCHWLT